MLYNTFTKKELDVHHPSLEAVSDLKLHDLSRLEVDFLYGARMRGRPARHCKEQPYTQDCRRWKADSNDE